MEKKEKKNKSIRGFFVVMGDEFSSIKKGIKIEEGRNGVFFDKEYLISKILANEALKNSKIGIVEINVYECCITNKTNEKFSIKKNSEIKIIKKSPIIM